MERYVGLLVYTTKAILCIGVLILLYPLLMKMQLATPATTLGLRAVVAGAVLFLLPGLFAIEKYAACLQRWIARSAEPVVAWVETLSARELYIHIIIAAALSLFLELVLIRWQGSMFPVFALYKNFTLLACFCGLGIGYALSRRMQLLLPAVLPVLLLTLTSLMLLRFASPSELHTLLFIVPVNEESSIFGSHVPSGLENISFYAPVYILLIMTFLLNVLLMLPVGQFCGLLMEKSTPLTSYGCNLLGSILGVILLFALSWLWLGPVIWFGLCVGVILWYLLPSAPARLVSLLAAGGCVMLTGLNPEPLVHSIYSPYQLIQHAAKNDGLMQILASGSYYQKVFDLSADNVRRKSDENLKKVVAYYELPFATSASLNHVAIVGAGSGNDVAAALRYHAKRVDAVEIDPAIRALGLAYHPEHPYSDPRVHGIVNDARTFFRNTHEEFDTIVYGVLDSHILLSHGSNVRVDSFVYTQEGLREAYSHLLPGGLMSVAFALPTERIGQKIYQILRDMPDASAPLAVVSGYDSAITTTFMVRKGAPALLPASFMTQYALRDVTQDYASMPAQKLDLPSDDWPFFYMENKMYPASYVCSLLLVLALSVAVVRGFLPSDSWRKSLLPFFFLGGGFMLVETKAITELGLLFGNTWQVVGITIMCVLVMAFLANLAASRIRVPLTASFVLLLAIVALGYYVAMHGSIESSNVTAKLLMPVLLTGPLFFSGLVFSTLFKSSGDISGAMSYNLMGAMLGGLLEYNSMEFGFAFLYLLAFGLYICAWISSTSARA